MASVLEMFMFLLGVFLQFVLEVLGAGGAIWGMSEVWNMRGGKTDDPVQTNDNLRWAANIVFCLGFIRVMFRYAPETSWAQAIVDPQNWVKDYGAGRRAARARAANAPNMNAGDGAYSDSGIRVFEFVFFALGVFLQWVLEVLGAGGATWGMSEVWHLRGDTSNKPALYGGANDDFRWVANITFTVAIFRMLQKYCPDHVVHKAMLSPQDWLKDLGKDDHPGQNKAFEAGRSFEQGRVAVQTGTDKEMGVISSTGQGNGRNRDVAF